MDGFLSFALKEWAVAVEALEAGSTILLLRKGGIREEKGRFKVEQDRVLLYPTFEHQKSDLLKPEYGNKVESVESNFHPETVKISSWAEITDVFLVAHEPAIKALLPYHIWNDNFISERLKWKPREPVYILLLKVYILPQPQNIIYQKEYSGCKSWIKINENITIKNSLPALTEAEYNKQANTIRQTIANPP